MSFASESFSYADGATLSTENPAWSAHPSFTRPMHAINGRARAGSSGTGSFALHFHSATPPSADYEVAADIYYIATSAGLHAGVAARVDASASTFYWARYHQTNGIQLQKNVAGTSTGLGTDVPHTMAVGETLRLLLRVEGDRVRARRDLREQADRRRAGDLDFLRLAGRCHAEGMTVPGAA